MSAPFATDLDTPLLRISPHDHWTLRDAFNGLHCWGGIGSGKTSGTGKAVATALLRAGFGGVVFVSKPEEVPAWINYAQQNGRGQYVVLFDERKGFNFLDHQLARHGLKGIGSVTECLMHVLEAADNAMGAGGKSPEPFWDQSARQRLNYTLPLLYSAYGRVSVSDIVTFAASAAEKPEDYKDPAIIERSFAAQTMRKAVNEPAVKMPEAELKTLLEYWFLQHTKEPPKTKGNVDMTLSSKLDRFQHGRMRDMFCGDTNLVPEMIFHGAIIILNMPTLVWNEDGIIGQQLFKYCAQRTVESRNSLDPRQQMRPVFFYADEAQYVINSYDDTFLSTARGSRAAVVYLSQTLPSYYARVGKDKTDAVDGFVGKFNTQVFHLNACNRTNKYASDLIGRDLQWRATQGRSTGTNRSRGMNEGANENRGSNSGHGSSYGGKSSGFNSNSGSNKGSGENWGVNVGQGTNESESWSEAEQMDNLVEPRFFASALKSGGPRNKNLVQACWFKAGGNFEASDGSNWLLTTFRQ
jgi:hypothetical protein